MLSKITRFRRSKKRINDRLIYSLERAIDEVSKKDNSDISISYITQSRFEITLYNKDAWRKAESMFIIDIEPDVNTELTKLRNYNRGLFKLKLLSILQHEYSKIENKNISIITNIDILRWQNTQ